MTKALEFLAWFLGWTCVGFITILLVVAGVMMLSGAIIFLHAYFLEMKDARHYRKTENERLERNDL